MQLSWNTLALSSVKIETVFIQTFYRYTKIEFIALICIQYNIYINI